MDTAENGVKGHIKPCVLPNIFIKIKTKDRIHFKIEVIDIFNKTFAKATNIYKNQIRNIS